MKTIYRYSKTGEFQGQIECHESELASIRRYTEIQPPEHNPQLQKCIFTGTKWKVEDIPQPKDYFITDSVGQIVGITTLQPDETIPENHIEKTIETGELYFHGIPRYYIKKDGTITERTEAALLAIIEATERETYRKAYCQLEIRKVYSQDKEFQLQRKGIMNPKDKEFIDYFNTIENIINNSKSLKIKDLL